MMMQPVIPPQAQVSIEDAKRGFLTIKHVHTAAEIWYGRHDRDHTCLAENRLMRGEVPDVMLTPQH